MTKKVGPEAMPTHAWGRKGLEEMGDAMNNIAIVGAVLIAVLGITGVAAVWLVTRS